MIVIPAPKFSKPQYRRATRPVKARRRVVPAAAPAKAAPASSFAPEVVICVGGTPGFGWLSPPSDEQGETEVIVTTDREMVGRYASVPEAIPLFKKLVDAHPGRSFRMMTIAPLGREDETFVSRNPLVGDVPQEVYRILTTSDTPARDLLVMVEDGLIDAAEATQALQGTGLNVADVHSAAAAETEAQRSYEEGFENSLEAPTGGLLSNLPHDA